MTKERLSPKRITTTAVRIVDRDGLDALTISATAEELAVVPSAIYSHFSGLDGLRHCVAVAATHNLTTEVTSAAIGVAGIEALDAMGTKYREFALAFPGQFASTLLPPKSNNDDLARATNSLVDVFVAVYRAIGLGVEGSLLAARTTRCAIHGFLALEHTSGTTDEHRSEFGHLLHALQVGLTT